MPCETGTVPLPDGRPIAVLCRQIEQATTDTTGVQGFNATADGAARLSSWTYDANGRLLSAHGPRGETTTYAYYADTTAEHTTGDLAQVNNPLGQVTQYLSYNPHGQVLRSIEPGGIASEYTYDLRERLTSFTDGDRRTTYRYDPAGQLIEVTLPNATQFAFSYDDAHRLTRVTDQSGNSVTYTLDNAGNRIQEQMKDPTGALSRTIGRAFDALGRVQQITGAAQ